MGRRPAVTRGGGSRIGQRVHTDGECDAPHIAFLFCGTCRLHAFAAGCRHAQFQPDPNLCRPGCERLTAPSCTSDHRTNCRRCRSRRSRTAGRVGIGSGKPLSHPLGRYSCRSIEAPYSVHRLCQGGTRRVSDGRITRRPYAGAAQRSDAAQRLLRQAGVRRPSLRRLCRCRCRPAGWWAGSSCPRSRGIGLSRGGSCLLKGPLGPTALRVRTRGQSIESGGHLFVSGRFVQEMERSCRPKGNNIRMRIDRTAGGIACPDLVAANHAD